MSSITGIQGSRPPDQRGLDFPKNKCILWDKTATAKPAFLHIGYYRKPKVYIPEKILKLVQHQCEIYGLKCHMLIGSMVIEDDGEGVQFQVDRLDTRPLVSPDYSANLTPGDLLIPFEVTNNATNDRYGSVGDFASALERLQVQCCSKDSIDMSNFVLLKAWGSFYSNSASSVIHMDFDLVTMGTVFKATPIISVPIALTALSKNLAGPMSLSSTQGMPKSGYLTMDHTRKLLLVLESDPKAATLPIVGIWVSGADFVQHPFVWAACLRYIYNTHLQDRVCVPPDEFLLVLYSKLHTRPEFFQCCTTTGDMKPMYELRSGHEVGNLTKALSNPSQDFFEIELNPPEHGEKKSIFDAAVDQFNPSLLNPCSESHSAEWAGMPEDIQPRSAPTPYTEKIPVFKPMVPDVSILWSDASYQSDSSLGASHQALQHPHQSPMNSSSSNDYSKPHSGQSGMQMAQHNRHPFHNVPGVFSTRSSYIHPEMQSSQPSPNVHYFPQMPQRQAAPAHTSSSVPKLSSPYSSTPSNQVSAVSRYCQSQVPQNVIPSSSHDIVSSEKNCNTRQHMRPVQHTITLVNNSKHVSERNASTHGCSFSQATQSLSDTISVSAHQNGYFLQTSQPGQSSYTAANMYDNSMNRSGTPISYAVVNSATHCNQIDSFQSPKNRVITKDSVSVSSSPQKRDNFYPCRENSPEIPRVTSIADSSSSINYCPAMSYPSMNHMYNHHPAQSQLIPSRPSGQNVTVNASQQDQPVVVHQNSNLRNCHTPNTRLNTVIEENLSSTSSSDESCQCRSVRNSQLSNGNREESLSGINGSNNTHNSTKSSDDDSGLSVTPERSASSPHPNSNLLPPPGPIIAEVGNEQPAMSSMPSALIDNVNWENVPPEIRTLIFHQNEQLKQLQQQIQFLMMKESKQSLAENSPVDQSPSEKVTHQQKELCSVAVNTSIARGQNEECYSRSAQTSPLKPRPINAKIPPPSISNGFINSQKRPLPDEQLTEPTAFSPVHGAQVEDQSSPQPQMSVPSNELVNDRRFTLTDSETMDDSPHGNSLEIENSSSDRNFFNDAQNDSFSTMAEEASDPRQYYDQLMNNIQLFLLNGENDEEDSPTLEEKTTSFETSNAALSLSHLPDTSNATLTPQINYMSMMFGLGSDSGQSMEINAMAMKYLKDEQLTQLARLQQKCGTDANSNAKILQKVIGDIKQSTSEVSHLGISPNDMTMGTRKYLEKHGLLGDNSADINEILSLDQTMKLKTDFSLAYFNQSSTNNDNDYQHGQWARSSGNTPIQKEFVDRHNPQTPVSPPCITPKSKITGTGRDKKIGVHKDIGASPVLVAPKRYNLKETLPMRYHSKAVPEHKKKTRNDGQGMLHGHIDGNNAKTNSENQEEENILDIAKLKMMPKLL